MAIGLFIGYRDSQKEDRYVPIASDAAFVDLWKPIGEQLGLRWTPRFPLGWTLSVPDIQPILEELGKIARFLSGLENRSEAQERVLVRAQDLSRELQDVYRDRDAEAFIGSARQSQRRMPSPAMPVRRIVHNARTPQGRDLTMASPVPTPFPVDPLPGKAAPAKPPRLASGFPAAASHWLGKLSSVVPPTWRTPLEES